MKKNPYETFHSGNTFNEQSILYEIQRIVQLHSIMSRTESNFVRKTPTRVAEFQKIKYSIGK